MSDPEGRRTLSDLVADRPERLFHVGRLDTDTSGLLLLTNDGDFAQRMAHPSYEVDKTYVAEVEGEITRATIKTLLAGVTLEDGPVTVSQARIVSAGKQFGKDKSIVELVIHEGRNRIRCAASPAPPSARSCWAGSAAASCATSRSPSSASCSTTPSCSPRGGVAWVAWCCPRSGPTSRR
jgi:pseudouridine synthase